MSDDGFGWLTPEFAEKVRGVLEDRGASAFEGARFFRLPPAAQRAAVPYLLDRSISVRELLDELEEEVERRRNGGK